MKIESQFPLRTKPNRFDPEPEFQIGISILFKLRKSLGSLLRFDFLRRSIGNLKYLSQRNCKCSRNSKCQLKRWIVLPFFQRDYGLPCNADALRQRLLSHFACLKSKLSNSIVDNYLIHWRTLDNSQSTCRNKPDLKSRTRRTSG
mgnify:CR=1 FL=1